MNTFKINITKEIYKQTMYCGTPKGEYLIGSHCAVAKGISALFPNAWIHPIRIEFYEDVKRCDKLLGCVPLPEEAIEMICAFDNMACDPQRRLTLREISFEVEIEDDLLEKLVDISSIEEILKDCPTLELV